MKRFAKNTKATFFASFLLCLTLGSYAFARVYDGSTYNKDKTEGDL